MLTKNTSKKSKVQKNKKYFAGTFKNKTCS